MIPAEHLEPIGKRDYVRVNYKYHYQDANRNLIFRYDSAPHHPHLAMYPAHKHVGDTVVEADPPDLNVYFVTVIVAMSSSRRPLAMRNLDLWSV
jgi:hypothetical protein